MAAGPVLSIGFPGRYAQEVQPNPKCNGCLHFDGQMGRTGACTIGLRPWLCGDGGAADIGYAPIARGAGTYLPGMSNHSAQAHAVGDQDASELYGAGSTRAVQYQQVSLGEEHVHFVKSFIAQHTSMQKSMCRLCKSAGTTMGMAPANVDPQICTCEPIEARTIAKALMPQLSNLARTVVDLDDATGFVYACAKADFAPGIEKATIYQQHGKYEVSPAGGGQHHVDFHPRGGGAPARVGTFGSRREARTGSERHSRRFAQGTSPQQREAAAAEIAPGWHAMAGEDGEKTGKHRPKDVKTPVGLPSMRGAQSIAKKSIDETVDALTKAAAEIEKGTATEVRSPTSTKTKTRTATEVRSPTSTSTDAYTQGNVTVTGGAGDGDTHVHLHGHRAKEHRRADEEAHVERSRGVATRPEKMMHETGGSRPDDDDDDAEKSLSWKVHPTTGQQHSEPSHGTYRLQTSGDKWKTTYQSRGNKATSWGNLGTHGDRSAAKAAAAAHHAKASKSIDDDDVEKADASKLSFHTASGGKSADAHHGHYFVAEHTTPLGKRHSLNYKPHGGDQVELGDNFQSRKDAVSHADRHHAMASESKKSLDDDDIEKARGAHTFMPGTPVIHNPSGDPGAVGTRGTIGPRSNSTHFHFRPQGGGKSRMIPHDEIRSASKHGGDDVEKSLDEIIEEIEAITKGDGIAPPRQRPSGSGIGASVRQAPAKVIETSSSPDLGTKGRGTIPAKTEKVTPRVSPAAPAAPKPGVSKALDDLLLELHNEEDVEKSLRWSHTKEGQASTSHGKYTVAAHGGGGHTVTYTSKKDQNGDHKVHTQHFASHREALGAITEHHLKNRPPPKKRGPKKPKEPEQKQLTARAGAGAHCPPCP